MNRKIKGFIVPLIMLCILFLSGCHIRSDQVSTGEYSSSNVQAYNATFDNSALRTYIDIYETKLLYMEMSGPAADFFIYNFQDGSNKKILTVDNFALKGISNALINNTLYFYVSLYNGAELVNDLYAVDFSTDKMVAESKNMYSQKLIPLTNLDNKLVSLQGHYSENGGVKSFMETLDSSKNMVQVRLHTKAEMEDSPKDNTSRQILYITSDEKYLYTIEKSNSGSDMNCFIAKYDTDFSFIGETDITDILKKYEITSGIGSFLVFRNYFSITDYSNNTIVCKFGEGDNQVLLFENDVECIRDFSHSSPYQFLYKRNTNEIYKLDTGTGKIEMQNFDLENDTSSIRDMLSYGNNLLIVKQPDSDSGKENVYLIPLNYEKQ